MNQTPSLSPPSPPCQEANKGGPIRRLRNTIACMVQDVDAVLAHDPAARSRLEVILTYPGLHALSAHRIAHALSQRGWRLSARIIAHLSRFFTGIEIHPGATIGRGVFIDHGMGVVIGETTVIGDECILYKGVVLGGTSTSRTTRHPQIGKHVVIGSNACILGAISIGDGARIGSGSVVIKAVPEGATVVGVPGRIVPRGADRKSRFDATLDHASLPDPIAEMMRTLRDDNESMRSRLERLEERLGMPKTAHEESAHLIDGDLATSDLPPPPPPPEKS